MTGEDNRDKLVYTIKDLCRVCYTCVRECPVKAIKIINGQAQILPERCIACGNCTKVCSQGAKAFRSSVDEVFEILQSGKDVAAIIAPSFPAEFKEIGDYEVFVGMVRELGFKYVHEVSFGADLVAEQYKKLYGNAALEQSYISSDCPAIVSFVERYHQKLIPNLAPIVSPMVATARVVKELYGNEVQIVFFGPCIAKKDESTEIDMVATFTELRKMFLTAGIAYDVKKSDFNEPKGYKGSVFPVSRGMLQTVQISDDISSGKALVASGKVNFPEVIKEFEKGSIDARHLELLCCEGCILGPGMSVNGKLYTRKAMISNYIRQKMNHFDEETWLKNMNHFSSLDFSASFESKSLFARVPGEKEIEAVLHKMGKFQPQDQLDCGACGYDTCRNHAIAVINGLAEVEMCLPYTIDTLHNSVNQLAISNEKLITMRETLKQAEKLAHMGQLSAGIAHELNNPLGVVIMYSNILLEECPKDSEIYNDLKLIVEQSERCKKIVGGLLNFARKNQVNHAKTDLNVLVKQSINSLIIPDRIDLKVNSKISDPSLEVDNEQMIQVISNLIKNAVEAMPQGGGITVELFDKNGEIGFSVSDTGTGIKQEDLDKVFEPFFTTKGIGKGTGLGLATAYGVVKMHKGQISVKSNTNETEGPTGTTFTITLPRKRI